MTLHEVKAFGKGLLKSWTVWFSAFVAFLPTALQEIQGSWDVIAPFVPNDKQALVMQAIALAIFVLRLKTRFSLVDKGMMQ